MFGGNDNDKLFGGKGDDKLSGDGGNDIFVFLNKGGADKILDFKTNGSNEKIDLSDVSKIKGFNDLTNNNLSEKKGNTVFSDDNGLTIKLIDIAVEDLSANDFIF